MRVAAAVAVVTLTLVPGFAAAQSGYAYGADHCYYFEAPEGWQMDNRAAADDGVPMVFYPNGSTWQSAEVAMYTRPSAQLQPDTDAIKAQVEDVIAMYRGASETVVAKQAERVASTPRSAPHAEPARCGLGIRSTFALVCVAGTARKSRAACTPPLRIGTPASASAISTPQSVPASMSSLK